MDRIGDIEAEIYFLTTEEGGRNTPAISGYRPQFYYDEHDWDAVQDYNVPEVYPGQTVTARLTFLSPQFHLEKLYIGKEFLIREGQKTVAKGRIIKILNLQKSAEEAKIREANRQK
jgi:elongation factor Tu